MEITPMIIFIWEGFIVLKLCQFVVYIGKFKPSWGELLTHGCKIIMILSMIFFGFEILNSILTLDTLTQLGKYVVLSIVWAIEFYITAVFLEITDRIG